jgi:hypothetical protein
MVGLLLALGPMAAVAQPTAAEKETARGLVESARAKRKKGDTQGAFADFKAAHAIMKVPTTGLELGKTQIELGLLVEARDTLLDAARLPEQPGEPRVFGKARAEAKELSTSLAERIPALRIVIDRASAGASPEISVDGTPIVPEALSAPLKMNPGKHVVVARLGSATRESQVVLAERESREVTIDVAALVKEGEPQKPSTRTNPLVYIGFGVAGAGALTGAITGIVAITTYGDVATQCDRGRCPPETHDAIDRGQALGTVSTVAFAVGAAGLAAGVVGLFMPLAADEKKSAQGPRVWVGAGPGHVSVRGTF